MVLKSEGTISMPQQHTFNPTKSVFAGMAIVFPALANHNFSKWLCLSGFLLLCALSAFAQPITGVWRGKITKGQGMMATAYKVEVKLVKKGDSLTGTSYYYASPTHYYRFKVRGVFDGSDNTAHWWDEELIEKKVPQVKVVGTIQEPLTADADFNCPGEGIMKLDGTASDEKENEYTVHLDKVGNSQFKDEWDWIIDNYFVGGAHPNLIDSVGLIAAGKKMPEPTPAPEPKAQPSQPAKETKPAIAFGKPKQKKQEEEELKTIFSTPTADPPAEKPVRSESIEEKFAKRTKVPAGDIMIAGETVELHFYDNAEIDGDIISIFLNGKKMHEHVLLSEKPYVMKIAVADLPEQSELVMVAENLGSIPPNTSLMLAFVNGKRQEARLASSENSSAMLQLVKK